MFTLELREKMWLSMGVASAVRRRQNCAKHRLVSWAVLAVHANRASSCCFFKELFSFFLFFFNLLFFCLYCQNTSPLGVIKTLPVKAAVKGLTAADFLGTLTAHGTVLMVQPVQPEMHKKTVFFRPHLASAQSRVNGMHQTGLILHRQGGHIKN